MGGRLFSQRARRQLVPLVEGLRKRGASGPAHLPGTWGAIRTGGQNDILAMG
jgi:hypothetical protein